MKSQRIRHICHWLGIIGLTAICWVQAPQAEPVSHPALSQSCYNSGALMLRSLEPYRTAIPQLPESTNNNPALLFLPGGAQLPFAVPQILRAADVDAAILPTISEPQWRLGPDRTPLMLYPGDPGANQETIRDAVRALFERIEAREDSIPVSGLPEALLSAPNSSQATVPVALVNTLLTAERWAVLADLETGTALSDEIQTYWAACADEPTADTFPTLAVQAAGITQRAREALLQASNRLPSNTQPPSQSGAQVVVVWNPCAFEQTATVMVNVPPGTVVTTEEGRAVPQHQDAFKPAGGETVPTVFQAENLPALGYRAFYLQKGTAKETQTRTLTEAERLRTHDYLIDVDPSRGGVVRIIHRDSEIPVLEANGEGAAIGLWGTETQQNRAVCELLESDLGYALRVRSETKDTGYLLYCAKHAPGIQLQPFGKSTQGFWLSASKLAGNQWVAGEDLSAYALPCTTGNTPQPLRKARWLDLSSSLTVQSGKEPPVPIGPVEIVTGNHPESIHAGHALLHALLQAAIPSTLSISNRESGVDIPEQAERLSRLIIGPDEPESVAQEAIDALPDSAFHYLQARLKAKGWALLLTEDRNTQGTPNGNPALLLVSREDRLGEAVEDTAAQIAETKTLDLHSRAMAFKPEHFQGVAQGKDKQTVGLALVSRSGVQAEMAPGGQLHVAANGNHPEEPLWLLPHSGDWRTGNIAHHAETCALPCSAQVLEPGVPLLQNARSWLQLECMDGGAVELVGAFIRDDTLALFVRETVGWETDASLQTGFAIHRAKQSHSINTAHKRLHVSGRGTVKFRMSAFAIDTLYLELRDRPPRAQ